MTRQQLQAKDRLIVALDVDSADEAMALVDKLAGLVGFYKIGWQLFIKAGMSFVGELTRRGKKVFLDLKMGDIDETIRSALANLPEGIALLTIQGTGATVAAAKRGRHGREEPKLLMLTALSSQDDADIRELVPDSRVTREDVVAWKAQSALDAGCEGLIASGESVRRLREQFAGKDFIIVTPGIRPAGSSVDEHKRAMTPSAAISDGADYIVVGRPIRNAPDPRAAAGLIIEEIERAAGEG